MIWISSILLSLVFGYFSYSVIPKIMGINSALKDKPNLIVQSIWSIIEVLIWAIIFWLPQFLLISLFKDPEPIPRALSAVIISIFAFSSYRNERANNKKLYWDLITSKEHDITYNDNAIWDDRSSSIVFNAIISEHVNIKCKIPQKTLSSSYPREKTKKPLDIFNSHKYEILTIINNRIAKGIYDEPRTIIINEGEL